MIEAEGTPPAADTALATDTDTATAPAAQPDQAQPTAEQWQQLQATLAELQADKAQASAQAEEARQQALTAEQRQAEQQAALRADIEQQQAELRSDRRDIALDKLRVLPHFRDYVPDVDPRTTEGAAALEDWAKGHPEALRQTAAPAPDYIPRAQSKLADIASGKTTNPLVPVASLRKIMGGS